MSDWKRFNDQFRETEYERNARLRAGRIKRQKVRPADWTATQHVIADMFDAGMTSEQIRAELSKAAKIAAEQIMADLDAASPTGSTDGR